MIILFMNINTSRRLQKHQETQNMSCQDFNTIDGEDEIDAPVPSPESVSSGKFIVGTPPGTFDHMSYDGRKIKLGLCAMAKKVNSKPMSEILTRLQYFQFLHIVMFPETMISDEPVEDWPIVDCLICFHSAGFPLDKAVEYETLRHPFMINELQMQYILMDRRKVHQILDEHCIPQPKYAIVERTENSDESTLLIEHEDHIEVNGVTLHKPFVEKPISAEDHNVYIYYPSSAGGGSQRLFRKIGSRSSVYSPVSRVRTTGSFIYEKFMPTDGTDVKVYTVGADYAHAEARKAPALDGKVERDENGKEVRYPVILTAREKMVARKVCLAFKQNVCGFDLLRTNGSSLVCDVNGFSFVKTSSKYYDDCASVLGSMILRELAPQLKLTVPPELADPEVLPIVPTTYGTMMELRCVIAVIRHGDRTPKQKMKMEVKHERFFELFQKYGGYKTGQLKLKHPKQLQEVLDIARCLLDEIDSHIAPQDIEEKRGKVKQLKSVLEMYGHFSGINRKIQLKYQPHGFISASSADECHTDRDSSLVLILKWGGELTPAGKRQAEELGKAFRCIYPSYGETPGLGLLRLHSTYRHDLKIYASDEGRVQMTAASFAKGFLALEGELTPILVQMVKSGTHTNGLLDNADEAQAIQKPAKQTLQEILNKDSILTDEDFSRLNSINSISLDKARKIIGNPKETLELVHKITADLLIRIDHLKALPKYKDKGLYHSESLELMSRRYRKLERDFKHKNGYFEVSKIPDIYDNIKYDLLHNYEVLEQTDALKLYHYCKALADIVIPQEYGLSQDEKLNVGVNIAKPLLKKIRADLLTNAQESEDYTRLDSRFSMGVSSPDRHVRTRLYFTSESHIHSILSLIRHGGLADETVDDQWFRAQRYLSGVSELNYLSQIVIMMYEDPSQDKFSDERFHIELHFSPGAYGLQSSVDRKNSHAGGYRPNNGTSSHGSPVQDDNTMDMSVVTSEEILHPTPGLIINTPSSSDGINDNQLSPHDTDLDIQRESDRIIPESGCSTPVNESEETVAPLDCDIHPHESSAPISVQCFNSKRHHSVSGGTHFSSPPGSTLISTKVISGSHSAPNLQEMNASRALEAYGLAVPEIMPMETLHNSLTLKHFDNFITKCVSGEDPAQKRYKLSLCTSADKARIEGLSASLENSLNMNGTPRPINPNSALDAAAVRQKK